MVQHPFCNLDMLYVTQDDIRDYEALEEMIKWVQSGLAFDAFSLEQYALKIKCKPSPLIRISRFEDGFEYVHDGHHRCVSIWLAGRRYLYESECIITEWTYEQYIDINLDVNWITPFDPRTETRIPNLNYFRKYINGRINEKEWTRVQIENFIRRNKILYAGKRQMNFIPELAEYVNNRMKMVA